MTHSIMQISICFSMYHRHLLLLLSCVVQEVDKSIPFNRQKSIDAHDAHSDISSLADAVHDLFMSC